KLDVLLAVDLKGTIACSYAAGAVMRRQEGGGAIVNMSWDHATLGMAGENPELFSAVKGGVLARLPPVGRGGHAAGALGTARGRGGGGAVPGLACRGVRHRSGDQRQRR